MANTNILERIKSSGSFASVDAKWGPYASVAAAHAKLGENGDDVAVVGLTVGIVTGNTVTEYWYQGGTTQAHLVPKQAVVESTPEIDINELDDMIYVRDGQGIATQNVNIDIVNADSPLMYNVVGSVTANGQPRVIKVGVLFLTSDSSRHTITQILITHFVVRQDGGLDPTSHSDSELLHVYRNFYMQGAHGVGESERNKWSKWKRFNSDYFEQIGAMLAAKADKSYVDGQLSGKVDKVAGKGLSTNDYTNDDKQAVATIGNKANASDVYLKADTYNKTDVDNKVDVAVAGAAFLGDEEGEASVADFDPRTDTLWKKEQLLSPSEKAQVIRNLGISDELSDMQDAINEQDKKIALLDGHDLVVVDTLPTSESPAVAPDTDKIYRLVVTNGNDVSYEDYMYTEATTTAVPKKVATYSLPGVDDKPTAGSDNLVKSGGVYRGIRSIVDGYNTSSADLDFSDEQGNVLARFSDGHIKTKNFDSSKDATEDKRGLMSSTDKSKLNGIEEGAEVNDIITGDAEVVDLNISDEDGNILIQAKDGHIKTKNFDSSAIEEENLSEELREKVVNEIETDSAEFSDLDFSDEQGNVLIQVKDGHIRTKNFDSRNAVIRRYEDYRRRIPFTVLCNTTNFLISDFTLEDIGTIETLKIYADNCVLYLPSTYTADGVPTKIIIFCKQGASTIGLNNDSILSDDDTGRIFRYMLYLGYGILAADGVPNGWAAELKLGERAVGNYVAVQSTIHAFNYIREHYNIDSERVFIFGYSQGGHYAQNVIDNSNIPIVAAAELSPVCSMRYHQWDLATSSTIDGVTYTRSARLNIARIFNFPAFTTDEELLALQYDPQKTIGYDPWNRNVENMYEGFVQGTPYGRYLWKLPDGVDINDITMKKHCKCPLKIWAAENDASLGADVMKVFIKAIKNSGQVADLQLYSSGGHHIPTKQNPIGTFIENEETCQLYPIAKDIAIWFYNFGGNSVL